MPLTNKEMEIVVGMINRGDKQHDVAAWFGENSGRIPEILNGDHGNFTAAPADQLPPKGPPGIKGKRLYAFVEKALREFDDGNQDTAIQVLKDGIARFNKPE
jgi:hypothetical protein